MPRRERAGTAVVGLPSQPNGDVLFQGASEGFADAAKQVGFVAVLMLTVLTVLLYLTNKRIWAPIKGKKSV